MSRPTKSVEFDLDDRGEYREWFAERIGWALCALFILAAMVGLLGPGVLSSSSQASSDGALTATGGKLQRREASTELTLRFQSPADATDVALAVSRSFTDAIEVEEIIPAPNRVEMGDEQIIYHFDVSQLDGEGTILFRYQHRTIGWLTFECGISAATRLTRSLLVLP